MHHVFGRDEYKACLKDRENERRRRRFFFLRQEQEDLELALRLQREEEERAANPVRIYLRHVRVLCLIATVGRF